MDEGESSRKKKKRRSRSFSLCSPNKKCMAERRASENPSERLQRQTIDAAAHRRARSNENAAQTMERQATNAAVKRRARSNENAQQTMERQAADATDHRRARSNENAQQTMERQAADATAHRRARSNENAQQTMERQASHAAVNRRLYSAQLQAAARQKKNLARKSDVQNFIESDFTTTINGVATPLQHELPQLKQPSNKCTHCGAYTWRTGNNDMPKERNGFCCESGKVPYEAPCEPPQLIRDLYAQNPRFGGKTFLDNLRSYNNSLALASIGCQEINMPGFSPTFKLQGKVHHSIGSLLPPTDGDIPTFAQIYFHDTEHEVDHRLHHNPHLSRDILEQLQQCMHNENIHVQNFKCALELDSEQPEATVVLQSNRPPPGEHVRRYNAPSASEVAVLLPGEQADELDVILKTHTGTLMRINTRSPFYDPLHYVLLFPYGTPGYTEKIPHNGQEGRPEPKNVSPYEFYRVRLQIRDEPDTHLLKSRRLMQQYVCDQEAKAEGLRLKWHKDNQKVLKADKYCDLHDAALANDERRAGQQIVLSPSFTGGPRWYAAKFQDAMAIVRERGKPSLFITFTCNPKWPEIAANLNVGEKPSDRPDLTTRVFHLKLNAFVADLDKSQVLGRVVSYFVMKEDQKRGLPHAHILLILHEADRIHTPETVDTIISAEIPDKQSNPTLYDVITTCNIHGPCGNLNPRAPCMVVGDDGISRCSKGFPKQCRDSTFITDESYPEYRRRSPESQGRTHVTPSGHTVDNSWVVPYNPYLSAKYNAHINVEYVHTVGSVKYLYKYLCKGSDRVLVRLDDGTVKIDEIQTYEDARYIGCGDAFWRIYEFPIQLRYPSVEKLPLHLEDEQTVVFTDENAKSRADAPPPITKLTAYFELNSTDPTAASIRYPDIYRHYTWNRDKWVKRKNKMGGHHRDAEDDSKSETVGRIPLISLNPHQSELYFLRMMLYYKPGAQSYEDLRTIDGELQTSFQAACRKLGLLDDETILDQVIDDSFSIRFGKQLREVFVTILIWAKPSDPLAFWDRHLNQLCEDLMRRDGVLEPTEYIINEVLIEIKEHLESRGCRYKKFKLPVPNVNMVEDRAPREIREETEHDHDAQNDVALDHVARFTDEQRHFYTTVMTSVHNNDGKIIGLDAPGGCGKSFCLHGVLAAVRSEGNVALATATSGIAATLLPNGRTLHSRFKVPVKVTADSTCNVTKRSSTGQLILRCKLLVIDEVTMSSKKVYECIDRTCQFIRDDKRPFGGMTVVLSGDWRQILPVVRHGSHADVLGDCLKTSPLWKHVTPIKLTQNMRVQLAGGAQQDFAQFLLSIGDGTAPIIRELGEFKIQLPDDIVSGVTSLKDLCDFVFESLLEKYHDPQWLCARAILCPTNEAANDVNKYMMRRFPGDARVYTSCDKIVSPGNNTQYPTEFLNTLEVSGLPRHCIPLKIGVPIMLLRNLDPPNGHCNGTRYVVVGLHDHVIEARVATGVSAGKMYFIPRIPLSPSENFFPFELKRRQFPIRVCFGMTSNKSQGQTLLRIGIYLPKHFFSHGQFYVAMSRVGSRENVKVMCAVGKDKVRTGTYTDNVVLKQILS